MSELIDPANVFADLPADAKAAQQKMRHSDNAQADRIPILQLQIKFEDRVVAGDPMGCNSRLRAWVWGRVAEGVEKSGRMNSMSMNCAVPFTAYLYHTGNKANTTHPQSRRVSCHGHISIERVR